MGLIRFTLLGFLICHTLLAGVVAEDSMTRPIDAIPADIDAILRTYCADCHGDSAAEGDFELPVLTNAWQSADGLATWEQVHLLVSRRIMPPPNAAQLTDASLGKLTDWVADHLMHRSPVGGTTLRRLSRREYTRTVADLFDLKDFSPPDSFPEDNRWGGFDNQAESLVIAASHLEALAESATTVADEFFPPPRLSVASRTVTVPAEDLTISYSSAMLIDGTMRLASSGKNLARHATWPSRFEAPARGVYRVEVTASSTMVDGAAELELRSHSNRKSVVDRSRKSLDSVRIPPGPPQSLQIELELDREDTIALRFTNGPFDYDNKSAYQAFLEKLFAEQPELAAAWDAVGKPPRGGSGWDRVREQLIQANSEWDLDAYRGDGKKLAGVIGRMVKNPVDSGETLVFKFFDEGPYVAIHEMRIIGPTQELPDRDATRKAVQRKRWLGAADGKTDEASIMMFLRGFLNDVFRRPATDDEVAAYTDLVLDEYRDSGDIDRGWHLAIRTALISPPFLYRGLDSADTQERESLSPHALATRLAYFLTSGPPDANLRRLADNGQIAKPSQLEKQTRRMIGDTFARDFTDQWLGLESLKSLMPDVRLMANFSPGHRTAMTQEVWQTFAIAMEENWPAADLIAPSFVLTNPAVARDIYGLTIPKSDQGKASSLQRYDVDPAGYRGGLLGMPALMMATANGVDTQPVLRGVWMLENILGSPPPEPPGAVPALTPDTTGANTPKERLAAHMADTSCASCHREIDPLGFALENFDPMGRWRDHYPRFEEKNGKPTVVDGLPVDASGVLPDGRLIRDVRDLKRILADDPTPFVRCLAEKWMTYATGRTLNFRERMIVADVVTGQSVNNYRITDLLVALVQSDVFLR